ncbi:MAG: IclR family transcriptional regulator [Gammaproteobacteria bacterium]|nr:IclR family transcriptional regulator [Gammaproteobacteria bacterium]
MTKPKRGSALDKALIVMDAVMTKDRPVSLAYLTEELSLAKPTIHRILRQLEQASLIQRAPQKDRYWIGPRLNALAAKTLGSRNQPLPTRSILERLVEKLGETCNLGILDQHEVVYLERVECNFPLRFELKIGSRVPAHCTAIGKLLLAHLAQDARERVLTASPLKRYTENTIVDRDKFDWELAKIRQQGYSTNDQEYVPGLIAVAVPITDAQNRAIAAVAIHAPTVRLDLKAAISHIPALQAAALQLTAAWELHTAKELGDRTTSVSG